LERDPNVNKGDLRKLQAETKKAELEIQAAANKQIEAEEADHLQKLERIRDAAAKREKAEEKKRKAEILSDQRANFQLLQSDLQQQFAEIEQQSADNLKENAQKRSDALDEAANIISDKERLKIERQIEFDFTIADFDEQQRALKEKLDAIQAKFESANLLNNISVQQGLDAPFSTSELEKFAKESARIRTQITESEKNELKISSKNKKDANKVDIAESKRTREFLKDAAIKGAEILANGIFDLKKTKNEAEKEEALRTLETEYKAKLDAAQGNATQILEIEKDYKEQKRLIEIKAVEDNAKLAKQQALIGASLAIIATLAQYGGTPIGVIASALVALKTGFEIANINAQADKQIAALRAEKGTIISLSGNAVKPNEVMQGKYHTEGGNDLVANGRLVNAEKGEYIGKDEFGNVVILSRQKTKKYQPFLERYGRETFSGKSSMLQSMHMGTFSVPQYRNGGNIRYNQPIVSKAETGGFISPQNFLQKGGQAINVSTTTELTDAQVILLARTIATTTGQAVKDGVISGSQESNRISERVQNAVNNSTL
jgi:hypothetical protein